LWVKQYKIYVLLDTYQDSTARPKQTTTASINSAAKPTNSTSSPKVQTVDTQDRTSVDPNYPDDPNMPPLENIYYDTND
jgi:hypothetical protein